MKTLAALKSEDLINSTHIKIAANLEIFPEELYTLIDTLEVLDLTDNNLSYLPDDFDRFKKLKRVFYLTINLIIFQKYWQNFLIYQ
jgi:hypothetical protein